MSGHRVQIVSAKRVDKHGNVLGIGQWFVEHDGVRIGEFARPEADAARRLLDHGLASPADTLSTYRGDMRCLTGNVGKFAGVAEVASLPPGERQLAGLAAARMALATRRSAALASVKTYRDGKVAAGEAGIAKASGERS